MFDGKFRPVSRPKTLRDGGRDHQRPRASRIYNKRDGVVYQVVINTLSDDNQKINNEYIRMDKDGKITGVTHVTYIRRRMTPAATNRLSSSGRRATGGRWLIRLQGAGRIDARRSSGRQIRGAHGGHGQPARRRRERQRIRRRDAEQERANPLARGERAGQSGRPRPSSVRINPSRTNNPTTSDGDAPIARRLPISLVRKLTRCASTPSRPPRTARRRRRQTRETRPW